MSNIESNRINICLSCDESYSKYAGVVIASILYNAKVDDEIHIYILDGNIQASSKDKILSLKSIKPCTIEFINVNEEDFNDYAKIQTHKYISAAACYRLKLPTLLPQLEKVIYLDCDVVVCSSLRELFNIDLQNSMIAGVLDIDIKRKKYRQNYVNSGVLLMNLNKMREQNVEDKLLTFAQQNINNITMGDQEIINSVLTDDIMPIDEAYNVQSECFIRRSSFTKNPKIVHFIGNKKPWQKECWSVHRDLYYKYLQMTPWQLSKAALFIKKDVNKIKGILGWFMHRPFFYFQNKFWQAVKKDIQTQDKPLIFVIVLMACFGDIVLCNSLFKNIKRLYPDSKIIFIVDKPWLEAAKYQPYVDEVFIFDKRGKNKGITGILSFVSKFPYKKADYVFKIYQNDRASIIAWLLRPKKIVGGPYDDTVTVQERHNNLLKKITSSEIINYPIEYFAKNDIPDKFRDIISDDKKYIALCPCLSRAEKNMPIETAVGLINKLNADNYQVIIVGSGKCALKFNDELTKNHCEFINLVNQTTIYELAQVLRYSKALISVDTGTMHFGYANKVPTVCLYYQDTNIKYWAPRPNIYPYTIMPEDLSTEGIYKAFRELEEKYINKEEL